jgi:hypothetical protein
MRRTEGDEYLVMGRCCGLNYRNPRAIAVVEQGFFKFGHLHVKQRGVHVRHVFGQVAADVPALRGFLGKIRLEERGDQGVLNVSINDAVAQRINLFVKRA